MRIAHVTPTYPPYLAGTGNVAMHNARELARLGHEVTVYTARTPGTLAHENGSFHVRRLWPLLRIGNAPLLPGLSRLPRYDLVHLHYPFIFGAETVMLRRWLRGQPYVLTYHNDLISPGIKGGLFKGYEWALSPRIMRGALRVFVPAIDMATTSPILGPFLAAGSDQLEELPNGVDTTVLYPRDDGAAIRKQLGLDPDQPVLLFVGAMDAAHFPKIGVHVLIDAMASLNDPRVALVLVGDGDLLPRYAAQAERAGLTRQVHFVGRVDHDRLASYFAAADICVQPSVYEPFGLVAVEAMACAKPVITADVSGTRRVVGDAGGGILFRAGDPTDLAAAIRRLVADPELQRRLGRAGLAAVEARYAWRRIGRLLVDAYERALARA